MNFKNSRAKIVLACFVLVLCGAAAGYAVFVQSWMYTPLVLLLVILITVVFLIKTSESAYRNLLFCVEAIEQGMRSFQLMQKGSATQRHTAKILNTLIEHISSEQKKRLVHLQYLEAFNEGLSHAILSFDSQGNIYHTNSAARKLFNQPNLTKVQQIWNKQSELQKQVESMRSGESAMIKLPFKSAMHYFNVVKKRLTIEDQHHTLLVIQKFQSLFEENESKAWQDLTRVIGHEILNSMTPIISLSQSAYALMEQNQNTVPVEKMMEIVESIQHRGKGILQFTQAYQSYVTDLPIEKKTISLSVVLHHLSLLFQPYCEQNDIVLELDLPKKDITLFADAILIEQLLVNLVKNALDALQGIPKGRVIIQGTKNAELVEVSIQDNGKGMSIEELKKVGIPFFTTKPNGSGIGLALCRKIMLMHDGNLDVFSTEHKGTTVLLRF